MSPSQEHRHHLKNRSHRMRAEAQQSQDQNYTPMVLPEHEHLPLGEPSYVDQQADLEALCKRLKANGYFAYDTEFIGETSYVPKICLIQVATTEELALIDPLAGLDLTCFWSLLADETVTKVVHCGLQDLEPVVRYLDLAPANIFDTQYAAGYCDMTYPVSLSHLVEWALDIKLSKASTFTLWDKRPLTPTQLAYAADDVRFLPLIYQRFLVLLKDRGMLDYCHEECNTLCDETLYRFDAMQQLTRVISNKKLKPPQQAALLSLIEWRDRLAKHANLPHRSVLSDGLLVQLVKRMPKRPDDFAKIKHFPQPLRKKYEKEMLDMIAAARSAKESLIEVTPKDSAEDRQAMEKLMSLTEVYLHGKGISPSLVASKRDYVAWYHANKNGEATDGLRLLQGWRGDLLKPLFEGMQAGNVEISLKIQAGDWSSELGS